MADSGVADEQGAGTVKFFNFGFGWTWVETFKFLRGTLVALSGAVLLYITTHATSVINQPPSVQNLLLFVGFSMAANFLKLLTTDNTPAK